LIQKKYPTKIDNPLNNKKVVVTGGAGFIGSWLTEALVQLGCNVSVVDDLSSGKLENLRNVRRNIRMIKADICEPEALESINAKVDVIFHLAALASVPESVQNPKRTFESNVIGTFNLLRWMRKLSNEVRIIFASSAAVYGEPRYVPIDEEHPLRPTSPYGASKISGEAHCTAFNEVYGVKVSILRLFNIYGPRQPRYVVYDFLRKLLVNRENKLVVLGNGKQIRDFTFVTDAVEGILSAAVNEDAIGERINIGSGKSISIENLARKMLRMLDLQSLPIEFTQRSWEGDVSRIVADPSKARKLLGFKPKMSIEEGIKEEIKWFKEECL
jgi:nucleoside-diphosphate-sugar epimerase